jgi:hypothetical protein
MMSTFTIREKSQRECICLNCHKRIIQFTENKINIFTLCEMKNGLNNRN